MNAPLPDPGALAEPRKIDPRRYFEGVGERRAAVAAEDPVCLYLEVTNRCNLLCGACPRTFEELEPPADMSFELFTRIVDQFPKIERVVLHGVGEPMMVAGLPKMVRYLKEPGVYVLFNTNGTLMREKKSRELIEAGLDEMRISLDAAERKSFAEVRGRDMFDRIVRNVRNFVALKARMGAGKPRLSLWLTGLRETLEQLPAFIRLAHDIGVPEVHLQRLVYFEAERAGLARPSLPCSKSGIWRRAGISWRRSGSPPSLACSSMRPGRPSPRRACAASTAARRGRSAGGPGRSCISRRMAARCLAALRPSRCAATRISRWATRGPRPCATSGTAPPTRDFARRC